jgi:hypothetical protein
MEKVIVYGSAGCNFCRGAVKMAESICDDVEYKNTTYTRYYEELKERKEDIDLHIQPHIWVTDGGTEFYVGSYGEFREYCYNTQIPAMH